MIIVSRFRVPVDEAAAFAADARAAVEVLSGCPGFRRGSLGQSTDDAQLRTIVTEWDGVGSYRRALSRYEVKMSAIALLSKAIDEPSAYEVVHERTSSGSGEGPSGLAADAGSIGLGAAAGPVIPAVTA